jgi:hypothetical protein
MSYICFFEGDMKKNIPNWLPLAIIVVVLLIVQGCSTDTGLSTSKGVEQQADSIHNWLLDDKNYVNKEQYRKAFLKHFDEAIGQKNMIMQKQYYLVLANLSSLSMFMIVCIIIRWVISLKTIIKYFQVILPVQCSIIFIPNNSMIIINPKWQNSGLWRV